jgi:hypothetical protein
MSTASSLAGAKLGQWRMGQFVVNMDHPLWQRATAAPGDPAPRARLAVTLVRELEDGRLSAAELTELIAFVLIAYRCDHGSEG